MAAVLAVISALLGLVGFAMLSQATSGVGAVALGCLVGILARMAQAADHQKALLKRLPAVVAVPDVVPCPSCGVPSPRTTDTCPKCGTRFAA
jgi:hypothetical protein